MRSDVSDIIDSSEPDKSSTPYEPSRSLHTGELFCNDSSTSEYESTDAIIPTDEDPDMNPSSSIIASSDTFPSATPTATITTTTTISLPASSPPILLPPATASTFADCFITSPYPSDYNDIGHSSTEADDDHSSENIIEYIGALSSSANLSDRVNLESESDSNRQRDSDEETPSSINSVDIAAIENDSRPNSDILDQLYNPSASASEPYSSSEGIKYTPPCFIFNCFVYCKFICLYRNIINIIKSKNYILQKKYFY